MDEMSGIVDAMRSDLGGSRVDDLKLENGRPGKSILPKTIQMHQAQSNTSSLPPRKPNTAIANKWRAAIDKGEFDDDDAEAVKNLNRIGCGRLHAMNSALTAPSHQPQFNLPPPVQNPHHAGFQFKTSNRGNVLPERAASTALLAGAKAAVMKPLSSHPRAEPFLGKNPPPPPPSRPLRLANQAQQNRAVKPVSPMPRAPSASPGVRQPMPPTPPQEPDPRRILPPSGEPDPEPDPAQCFHKAFICVADRLAQGNGVAYLLASSPMDTGCFIVYLEGFKYIQYRILDMVNYIANSQELCPQFREPDGVSITTTSLVFAHQGEIALFMKKLRELRRRNPDAKGNSFLGSVISSQDGSQLRQLATSSSDLAVLASATMPTHARVLSKSQPLVEKTGQIKAGGAQKKQVEAQAKVQGSVEKMEPAQKDTTPPKAEEATDATQTGGLVTSLVDLSPPSPAKQSGLRDSGNSAHMSPYAMDLISLTQSPPASGNDVFQPQPTQTQAEDQDRDPDRDEAQAENQPMDNQERLALKVQQMLPIFRKASEIMRAISAEDRETTAKGAFADLHDARGAKEILVGLLTFCKKEDAATPHGPKYSSRDLFRLRAHAAQPPSWLREANYFTGEFGVKESPGLSKDKMAATRPALREMSTPTRVVRVDEAGQHHPYGVRRGANDSLSDLFSSLSTASLTVGAESVLTLDDNQAAAPAPIPAPAHTAAAAAAALGHEQRSVPEPEETIASVPQPATNPPGSGNVKGLRNSRWAMAGFGGGRF